MDGNKDDWMKNYGRYSTIAFQMIVIVMGGVFLGYKLDIWLNNKKHIFLVIVSIISGFLALFFAFRDLIKNK
jgi:ATP synthase protein I